MKVLVKLNKSQFELQLAQFVEGKVNDYYHVGGGKHLIGEYKPAKDLYWPITEIAKDGENTYGYGKNDRYIRPGYTISEFGKGAYYRTSAGNTWGVYTTGEGQYYGFYSGARSRVAYVTFDKEAEVKEYFTNGPTDMYWWEQEDNYLIRKGYDYSLRRFARHGGADINLYSRCLQSAVAHWMSQGKDVQTDVYRMIAKRQNPETLILNAFRGKRIPIDSLTGINAVAWNMLTPEVQQRITRWN